MHHPLQYSTPPPRPRSPHPSRLATLAATLLITTVPAGAQTTTDRGGPMDLKSLTAEQLLALSAPPAIDARAILHMGYDRLHGEPLGLATNDQVLLWKSPFAALPMPFPMSVVRRITFLQPAAAPALGERSSMVYLSNQDQLAGDILALEAEHLRLDTAFAGPITIPRRMIERITSRRIGAHTLYQGPDPLENWVLPPQAPRGAWRLENGSLRSNLIMPIGRVLENLPDQVDFEFDAEWQGQPNFSFSFFCEDTRNFISPGYALHFSGGIANLRRTDASIRISTLGASAVALPPDGRARFNVLVDKTARRIQLLVDGLEVAQWTDSMSIPGQGTSIGFKPEPRCGLLTISHIHVSRWSGRLPNPLDEPPAGDALFFLNGDRVDGQLHSITNGIAQLDTGHGPIAIPWERIIEITFGAQERLQAAGDPRDLHIALAHRQGTLTCRIQSWQDRTLAIASENVGTLTIDTSAIETIDLP